MDKKELNDLILSTFKGLEDNNFATLGMPDKPMWDAPLIGVAAGDDEYFEFLKEHIGPYDWCLFYKNGSCGKCINRCPVQAISFEGHDKNSGLAYEGYFEEHYWPDGLDRKDYITGCGLCQVGIPCQNKRP